VTVPNPPATGAGPPGPPGKTRLIKKPSGDIHVDTGRCDTDVRLALTRGLAEYLEQLVFNQPGGNRRMFAAVHDEWAEPEENAKFPSAAVYLQGPGTYEARALTPAVNPLQRLPPPDGRYLVIPSEYVTNLAVEVWATDVEERTGLIQMLETALNPVYWRAGFVLELPHYYNVRATFVLNELEIPDDAEDAQHRYRRAIFSVGAQAPLIVLYSFPDFRPSFELKAVGPDVDVTVGGTVVGNP
jgi:hypothetical protein